MKFLYQYRTSDNLPHRGVIRAASKEAAYSVLKAQGINPSRVEEAPGFFNKLFGKGKRWLAIAVLTVIASVSVCFALFNGSDAPSRRVADAFDSPLRRQPIGDSAVIEQGIKTGWADVFELEGERFLASFAIPGVPAGQRNTSEDELNKALAHKPPSDPLADALIEARQIIAMVEGMKDELRAFLAAGGTAVEYGQRLVARQTQEIGYYNCFKTELERAKESGMDPEELNELWQTYNAKLRRLGIKLLPIP